MAVTTVLKITHADSQDVKQYATHQPREQAIELSNFLANIAAGKPIGSQMDVTFAGAVGAKAAGSFTVGPTQTGTLTAIINGVSIAVTAGANEAASAALLRTAIAASTDALVKGVVEVVPATTAVVSIQAVQRGVLGNCITIAATGTGFTTTGSKARLEGGAGDNVAAVAYSYV